MLRVAVDLDGAELVGLHQQRHRAGNKRMRRGKVHRLAENQIFRRFDVGIDRLIGLLGAAGQSGQRRRCAHEFEEAAPRNLIAPPMRRAGKLLLDSSLKLRRVGQLVHRAPVPLAAHVLQLLAHLLQRHRRRLDCANQIVFHLAHRWQTSQLANSFGVRIL